MRRHLITLSSFGFAAAAGVGFTLFPFPIAAIAGCALGCIFAVLQSIRDAEIEDARQFRSSAR